MTAATLYHALLSWATLHMSLEVCIYIIIGSVLVWALGLILKAF